jgi:hypothetical protein
MDTAWTGAATARPATSMHLFEGGATGTMWGNGAIGSGAGRGGVTLSCISCHNPHGNERYRILRPVPIGSEAGTPVDVTDETTKAYALPAPRTFGEPYGGGDYLNSTSLTVVRQCHATKGSSRNRPHGLRPDLHVPP